MIISQFYTDFLAYYGSQDYRHGILVEVSGIIIEILLLSIIVPVILYFVHHIRTRPTRAIIDFYLFQVFHKITRILLEMLNINDVQSILKQQEEKDHNLKIYSHPVYGNLENIIFVLKKNLQDESLLTNGIKKLTFKDFKYYLKITQRCLDEVDHLSSILVTFPEIQKRIFDIRILIYPLRDILEDVLYSKKKSDNNQLISDIKSYEIYKYAYQLVNIIEEIFQKRRKLVDSILKHQQWKSNAILFISLPYVLTRRWITIKICRIRKKPYHDFVSYNIIPELLNEWRENLSISRDEAANILTIPLKEYIEYEQGYRIPDLKIWETIKPHLRESYNKKESEQSHSH